MALRRRLSSFFEPKLLNNRSSKPSISPSFELPFKSLRRAKTLGPRWRNIPFLKSFVRAVTFSDVSSVDLDLDPNFHKSANCYGTLLDDLTRQGIACHVPRIFTFMIYACVTDEEFMYVMDLSRKFKHMLTPFCYQILLESLASSSFLCVYNMKQVFTEICSPDVKTLNIMIDSYCRLGLVVESNQYVCKMIQSGLSPDRSTFTSLIMGYSRTNGADAALRVFHKNMVQHECTPDLKCYEQLMMGICIAKRLGTAQRLLDQMQKEGIHPNGSIFDELVGCCCKLRKYREAADIVKDMLCSGYIPGLRDCKTLICGLYQEGEKEIARAVFHKLLQCDDLYDDEIAWTILIGGVLKKGLSDEFSQLYQAMQQSGCHFNPQTQLMLDQGLQGKTD